MVSEPRVVDPVSKTVPEEWVVCKAPALLTPVPLSVSASLAIVTASVIFKVAPFATVVPSVSVPKEYWFEISNIPALIDIAPSFWFEPPKTNVPAPDFVRLPESVIIPSNVKVVDELTLIVPFPVIVIPLFEPNVKSAVVFNVPPLKIILSPSAAPGVAPKFAELDALIVPAVIVVEPE